MFVWFAFPNTGIQLAGLVRIKAPAAFLGLTGKQSVSRNLIGGFETGYGAARWESDALVAHGEFSCWGC